MNCKTDQQYLFLKEIAQVLHIVLAAFNQQGALINPVVPLVQQFMHLRLRKLLLFGFLKTLFLVGIAN